MTLDTWAKKRWILISYENKMEYEANAFAAHLRIDNEQLFDLLGQGYDVVQLFSIMGTNINLMLIKLNELNRMGWRLNLPYVPRSDFLKKITPQSRKIGKIFLKIQL